VAPVTGSPIDAHGVRVSAPLDDPAAGGQPMVVAPIEDLTPPDDDGAPTVLVDGEPIAARLRRLDPRRSILVEGTGEGTRTTRLTMLDPVAGHGTVPGARRREILVDGWSVVVELESERRAALRDRARRGSVTAAHGGPTEVRAIIPGRILSVSVAQGDAVIAGQQLLVVEAMKMQNELRAPRDGTIERVAVGEGSTVELGDLLLVLG
jgi:biotin carboxyl carrier protein